MGWPSLLQHCVPWRPRSSSCEGGAAREEFPPPMDRPRSPVVGPCRRNGQSPECSASPVWVTKEISSTWCPARRLSQVASEFRLVVKVRLSDVTHAKTVMSLFCPMIRASAGGEARCGHVAKLLERRSPRRSSPLPPEPTHSPRLQAPWPSRCTTATSPNRKHSRVLRPVRASFAN